jgi:hypothetical protein
VAIALLSVALLAALALFALTFVRLEEANTRIDEQNEIIDKKETFGAAMQDLMVTAVKFDGVRTTAIVPFNRYEILAGKAWSDRWSSTAMDRYTAEVATATADLEGLLSAAGTEATTNSSGTAYEAVIDQLGGGFVRSLIDDADTACETDVLACVISDDPYAVHFDAADSSLPYMTDWLRTGLAYHEFAHVLQMTNTGPTATALPAFGDDEETMADCFALTYLPGWTLDHEIWTSSVQYWEVSIGYGYTCDESQKQVVREWYEGLGFHASPISQG